MPDLLNELRAALRGFRRRPLLPLVAVGILSLGLTASVAVLTYVNGFFQPFPGAEAEQLVRVFGVGTGEPYQDVSYLDYLDYAASSHGFAELAATQPFFAASVRRETLTEVAFLEAVSGSYFSVLAVETVLGRGLTVEDDRPGAAAAVLSYAWWQRSFGADPAVVGKTLYLNFRPFTVVGVAAPEFLGTDSGFRPDVWIPIAPFKDRYVGWAAQAQDRDTPLVRVYGRLARGASRESARAQLGVLAAGLDKAYPRPKQPRRLRLDAATWIDPRARLGETPTLRLMLLTAGVLLLLVCANVANLLVSVALGRQRETALRAALGASRSRLARQVVIETLLLSGVAGALALLLAIPASARLGSYFARPSVWGANVARTAEIDGRLVAFAVLLSVATGLVAGLLPALHASRRDLAAVLRGEGGAARVGVRLAWGWRLPGTHDALVAMQVALAVVLLVMAGLVLRTLASVRSLDPGFAYDRLVVTHISTSSTTLEVGDRERFFREVAERLSEEPWVRAATVADFPLLSPHSSAELRVEGQDFPVALVYSKVIPGFFEALGIEVREGRGFVAGDVGGAPGVAVVNERLARRFFPGRGALGRRLWWPDAKGGPDRVFEIVGVVRDTKTQSFLVDPEPTVYFSYPQHGYPTGSALLVSAAGDPRAALPLLQRWLRHFEPHLAIVNVVPYSEVVRGFLYTQRMNAEMFSALAVVGLTLAAAGLFSVMSLAVVRRTREIGIRMSVGARRRDIGWLMIGRAMLPVALGLGVGLGASLALTEAVRSLLFGVEPTDPVTLAGGAAALVAAALAAAYLPARRAASVDPIWALRHE